MSARILAIGDVHGCCTALTTLLSALRLNTDDTVIMLGDLVNRGPDSKGVVDRLIALQNECRLITVMGNHDEIFLHSLEQASVNPEKISSGAGPTLKSYGGSIAHVPQSHHQFFRQMVTYWETAGHIFVHASVDPELPLSQHASPLLRWSRYSSDQPRHCSGKIVVCGHTQQRSGYPGMSDHIICIDTAAYKGLWLTCLDVTSETVLQSNEQGEVRGLFALRDVATPLVSNE